MIDGRTNIRASITVFGSRVARLWIAICSSAVAVFYPVATAQTIVSLNAVPATQVADILECQFHVPAKALTYSGELDCERLAKLLDVPPVREYQVYVTITRTQAGQTTGGRLDILGGIVAALTGNWARAAEAVSVGDANNEATDSVTVRIPVRPGGRGAASLGGALNLIVGDELKTIPLGLTISVTHQGGYRPVFQLEASLTSLVRDLVTSGSTVSYQFERLGVIELELAQSGNIADNGLQLQRQSTSNRTGLRIAVEVK